MAEPSCARSGVIERMCEIDFYLGEFETHRQSKDKARKLLMDEMSKCPPHDVNYFAAKAGIDLMDRR